MRGLWENGFFGATLMGLAVAACSGPAGGPPSPATGTTGSTGGVAGRVSSALFGPPAQPGQGAVERDNVHCPPLDVRKGASTLTVYGPGDRVATNVRYQATVAQLARECAALGSTMTMKVGMHGRVITGPVGGAGQLNVPIRFALVQEGPEPKTIWTKLYRVAVEVPPGQTNVSFTYVEDNLTFPKPPPSELEAYIVYAGFDQEGLREQPRGRRQRR